MKYDEDKTLREIWNKMTPAKQEKTRTQIERTNAAVNKSRAALRAYEAAVDTEDKEWVKLAKCYGVPSTVFVD